MKETGTESLPHTSCDWCWGFGFGYEKLYFSFHETKKRTHTCRGKGTQLPLMVTVSIATTNSCLCF